MKLLEDDDPKEQQRKYNDDFQKRKDNSCISGGSVSRKVGCPAQQFACGCVGMPLFEETLLSAIVKLVRCVAM